MEGSSFVLSGENLTGVVIYKFDLNERISGIEFELEDNAQLKFFSERIPFHAVDLEQYIKQQQANGKKVSLKKTPADLSFDRFWQLYDKKASKKKQAQNIWNKMSRGDKVQCMLFIPKYSHMKQLDNTEKMYANTFLNQELWK